MFNFLRCSAYCRPSRTWITFDRFLTIFKAFVPHFYLCCTHCIIPKSLLNHPNSFCGGIFKLNAKFDADPLLYSLVILNVKATQYTCSLNWVYCPHWLVQWNRHCSCMCIPVHPPWLPGYIDVAQTVLVILTIDGVFRADLIYMCVCICMWSVREKSGIVNIKRIVCVTSM